jgi:hypothetical protein
MLKMLLKSVALSAVMGAVADCIHFYKPGKDITCHANVGLTGKTCVAIVGNRQSGPGLSATSEGGNYLVGLPSAAGRIFGVAGYTVLAGEKVPVKRGGIVPITVGATPVTAFGEVEVDAAGKVIPKSAGVAIGFACSAASTGADAEICLYNG